MVKLVLSASGSVLFTKKLQYEAEAISVVNKTLTNCITGSMYSSYATKTEDLWVNLSK